MITSERGDLVPSPTLLIADALNWYLCPDVNPVAMNEVTVGMLEPS